MVAEEAGGVFDADVGDALRLEHLVGGLGAGEPGDGMDAREAREGRLDVEGGEDGEDEPGEGEDQVERVEVEHGAFSPVCGGDVSRGT